MEQPADAARSALDRREWGHAYRLLSERAGAGPLSVDELDWLATAAYLTGRDEEAFDRWAEAHRAALGAGDAERAVRLGFRISSGMGRMVRILNILFTEGVVPKTTPQEERTRGPA